jgi:hypothetical protein
MASRPRVFVECGTFQARVTQIALEYFAEVHTIEASLPLYAAAAKTLARTHAELYHGDARVVLKDLAAQITEPAVFYLDANGWDFPDVVQDCPVLDLVALLAPRTQFDCVIVDEVHAFGSTRPGWGAVTVESIAAMLKVPLERVLLKHNCAVVYR